MFSPFKGLLSETWVTAMRQAVNSHTQVRTIADTYVIFFFFCLWLTGLQEVWVYVPLGFDSAFVEVELTK